MYKKNQTINIKWKQVRWLILSSVPSFFFLRGIHLISTGGGWIATTDQPIHWILLFLEIFIAAFAICGCLLLWYKNSNIVYIKKFRRTIVIKTIILAITFTFIIHFIRVGFWIQNLVS